MEKERERNKHKFEAQKGLGTSHSSRIARKPQTDLNRSSSAYWLPRTPPRDSFANFSKFCFAFFFFFLNKEPILTTNTSTHTKIKKKI